MSRRVGIRRVTREDGPYSPLHLECDGAGELQFGTETERKALCGCPMYHPELIRHPESCPALVLNADYTPLS